MKEAAGLHEPGGKENGEHVCDVQQLNEKLTAAILAAATTPDEATLLEAIVKQVNIQNFRPPPMTKPSIPTPRVIKGSINLFEVDDEP